MEKVILLHKICIQGMHATRAAEKIAKYQADIKDTFFNVKKLEVINIYLPTTEVSNVEVLYPLPNFITNNETISKYIDAINSVIVHLNELTDEN